MDDPLDLVQEKLKEAGSDETAIQLWKDILKWYNEGGPGHLQSNLELKFRHIKSQFLKSAREVEPDVRIQKRKVKKRKAKS
jgi:hypothetical protein